MGSIAERGLQKLYFTRLDTSWLELIIPRFLYIWCTHKGYRYITYEIVFYCRSDRSLQGTVEEITWLHGNKLKDTKFIYCEVDFWLLPSDCLKRKRCILYCWATGNSYMCMNISEPLANTVITVFVVHSSRLGWINKYSEMITDGNINH